MTRWGLTAPAWLRYLVTALTYAGIMTVWRLLDGRSLVEAATLGAVTGAAFAAVLTYALDGQRQALLAAVESDLTGRQLRVVRRAVGRARLPEDPALHAPAYRFASYVLQEERQYRWTLPLAVLIGCFAVFRALSQATAWQVTVAAPLLLLAIGGWQLRTNRAAARLLGSSPASPG